MSKKQVEYAFDLEVDLREVGDQEAWDQLDYEVYKILKDLGFEIQTGEAGQYTKKAYPEDRDFWFTRVGTLKAHSDKDAIAKKDAAIDQILSLPYPEYDLSASMLVQRVTIEDLEDED